MAEPQRNGPMPIYWIVILVTIILILTLIWIAEQVF